MRVRPPAWGKTFPLKTVSFGEASRLGNGYGSDIHEDVRASILPLLLCIVTAGFLFAGDIAPEETAKHVGEKVTVRGAVFEVFVSKAKSVYSNFGAKFPNQVFSAAGASL